MRKQTIGAAEFKVRCLELMDHVATTGNAIVITKGGKPVAQLVPVAARRRSLVGALKGHVRITGDIIAPVGVPSDEEMPLLDAHALTGSSRGARASGVRHGARK